MNSLLSKIMRLQMHFDFVIRNQRPACYVCWFQQIFLSHFSGVGRLIRMLFFHTRTQKESIKFSLEWAPII